MFKDPIRGMIVDEKKTQFVSENHGKKYYFCSPGCKQTFDKDPQKYAK